MEDVQRAHKLREVHASSYRNDGDNAVVYEFFQHFAEFNCCGRKDAFRYILKIIACDRDVHTTLFFYLNVGSLALCHLDSNTYRAIV